MSARWIDIVKNNTVLAPLAGYTDVGFRKICSDFGAGLTVTEMISAKALSLKNKKTFEMLASEEPKSKAAQLFGHDSDVFAEVVKFDEIQKFDIVDINMGCPVPKIVKSGEGSALMIDIVNASKIIKATVKNTNQPVSVKFRLGYTDNNLNCVEFAKMCFESGASALTIHARTKQQMYGGLADYTLIKEVVKEVAIPVYANGDIKSKDDCEKVIKETGCFGVSIGRGALGRPNIFSEIANIKVPFDVLATIVEHYSILLKYFDERTVINDMRKHMAFYLKGRQNSKEVLNEIMQINTVEDTIKILTDFFGGSKI